MERGQWEEVYCNSLCLLTSRSLAVSGGMCRRQSLRKSESGPLHCHLQNSMLSIQVEAKIYFCTGWIAYCFANGSEVVLIIEIKKVEINTDLLLTTKATAQALREAHVLLMEKNMVFALTNGRLWSFAKATKYGKVDQILNLNHEEDFKKILRMLKYIMKGEWPQLC